MRYLIVYEKLNKVFGKYLVYKDHELYYYILIHDKKSNEGNKYIRIYYYLKYFNNTFNALDFPNTNSYLFRKNEILFDSDNLEECKEFVILNISTEKYNL